MKKYTGHLLSVFSGLVLLAASAAQAGSPHIFPLDIKFETNKAAIQPSEQNNKEIKRLMAELRSAPYAKVEIQGYADSTGPEASNKKLSQERAEAVRKLLMEREGVPADRIVAIGKGEDKAPLSNDTAKGRSENRRVVARIDRLEEGNTQAPGTHIN